MKNGEKPIVNPFVILREEFDDWAVLFNPDTGHGFGLSPTGVFVWKLLNGEHTMDTLLEKVREHAGEVPAEAGDHIEAFVDALAAQGLAGFDRAQFGVGSGPEKSSSSPPEAVSEATPFKYEPPQLVDLSGQQTAHGDCSGGSGASGTCNTGHVAGSCGCGTSGTPAVCCVNTGNCADNQIDSNCCVGLCPYNESTCWMGISPHWWSCSYGSGAGCPGTMCSTGDHA